MKKQKSDEPSLDELVELAKQISLLIEDNNQNMKDCLRTLRQIKEKVVPKKRSLLSLAISKLLNTK